jgi:hypothetical protein
MALYGEAWSRRLNDTGYNLLRRPGRLAVCDVLGRDEVLESLGTLSAIAHLGRALPPAPPPMPAVDLAGQKGEQTHLSIALGRLRSWLQALSIAPPAGDLAPAFSGATYLQFQLTAPTSVGIDRVALMSAIDTAQIKASSPAARYLDDRNTDLFVVTDVVQMDRITFRAFDIGGAPVKIDVPALVIAAGPEISTSVRGDPSAWVSCRGVSATMAFRCSRMRRGRGPVPKLEIRQDIQGEGAVLFAPGTLVAVQ